VDRLDACGNILRMGPRDFQALPRYVAGFTVGIIPFAVNELTRAVNPIKLREMLAAGCPVVSTDLFEVRSFIESTAGLPAAAVTVAPSHGAFTEAVCRHLKSPLDQRAGEAISSSVSGETWSSKVDEILAVIAEGRKQGE
jgi:UDP-galactopyranose mutase